MRIIKINYSNMDMYKYCIVIYIVWPCWIQGWDLLFEYGYGLRGMKWIVLIPNSCRSHNVTSFWFKKYGLINKPLLYMKCYNSHKTGHMMPKFAFQPFVACIFATHRHRYLWGIWYVSLSKTVKVKHKLSL